MKIRNATSTERSEAAHQWASSFSPHARAIEGDGRKLVTIGSINRAMAPHLWRRAHQSLVQSMLYEIGTRLDVLVHDAHPTEPLGWVVTEGESLHYVYVVPEARRAGLGRQLVEHARSLGASVPTCTTAGGAALLAATAARTEAA